MGSLLRSLSPIIIASITTLSVLILCLFYSAQNQSYLIKEGGIIETMSAIGYFFCIFFAVVMGKWGYVKHHHYFLILFLLFGMRELDFDKRFTSIGLLKSKLYISETVPWPEKLIGLMVIAVILYVLYSVIRRHSRGFVSALFQLAPVHVGASLTFFLLAFTKTIDGFGRKLSHFGVTITDDFIVTLSLIEEALELGIPLLIFATLMVYFNQHTAASSSLSQQVPEHFNPQN